MVTVTSAEATKPKVFPMVACGSDSAMEDITVGCLATGYSPAASVSISWVDEVGKNVEANVLQYPEVHSGGVFSVVSHARMKCSSKYQCKAKYKEETITENVICQEQPSFQPTLYVITPSKEEIKDNTYVTFACLAKGFSPRQHKFKWLVDEKEQSGNVTSYDAVEENGDKNLYSATTFLWLPANTWKTENIKVTCKFEGKGENGTIVKNVVSPSVSDCFPDEKATVSIDPPSIEDYFLKDKVELRCKVTNAGNQAPTITWEYENGKPLGKTDMTNGDIFISTILISHEEWYNGTKFICKVQHPDFPAPKKESYQRQNGGKPKVPSVFILGPTENTETEEVTLICYAKDFYPDPVLISWLANDKLIDRKNFTTSKLVPTGHNYSVYSQLVIRAQDWEKGIVYSCAVHHETVDRTVKTITRAIDSVSKKATFVNLGLNIPQTCKA